jgi:WD40 repeat protein
VNVSERLYCGYDSAIRCFDTATPGRDCDLVPLVSSYLLPGSKRKRRDGQHGLISALSTSASAPSLLAAGSYSGDAAVYDSSASFLCTHFIGCHTAGISSISLHPPLLFVACRGETAGDDILCFDLRQSGAEVGRLRRVCRNNQRVEFEVREEGRWLLTGSQDGCVIAFDLSLPSDAETGHVPPACVVKMAAGDAAGGGGVVNGVAMHPLWSQQYPYFAAVTGSRVFDAYEAEQDDSDDDDDNTRRGPDASLSLWQVTSKQQPDTG